MAQVVTLESYRPSPRYDGLPWTQARIEEGTASVGPWTVLEVKTLSPADADPTKPAFRDFTTQLAGAGNLWYRVVFLDASGDTAQPTYPVQNIAARPVYASVEELAAILRVRAADRYQALQRVLETAASEIDSEIGTADINGVATPYTAPPPLVVEVSIERAVEHWQQQQSPFGIIGLGAESGATYTARDSWDRHALKLAPLKGGWGVA